MKSLKRKRNYDLYRPSKKLADEQDYISKLPLEILVMIFDYVCGSFVGGGAIHSIALTCRVFEQIVSCDFFIKRLYPSMPLLLKEMANTYPSYAISSGEGLRKPNIKRLYTYYRDTYIKVVSKKLTVRNGLPLHDHSSLDMENISHLDENIYVINPEIKYFHNLKTLDLTDNKIKILPPELFELKRLEILILNGNWLEVIPDELGNLEFLKKLELVNNIITSIPPTICGLLNLVSLDICKNSITELPEFMDCLILLEKICAKDNRIEVFPTFLHKLPALNTVFLSGNDIGKFPKAYIKQLRIPNLQLDEKDCHTESHDTGSDMDTDTEEYY
jgi:hypothetical protein